RHMDAWPMMANDRLGDCTLAAVGHCIEQWTAVAMGHPIVMTDEEVIAAYSAIAGYDPADPSSDQGAVELDVLKYWRKHGMKTPSQNCDKLAAVAFGDDATQPRISTAACGSAYPGLALPVAAQPQDVWDVPASKADLKGDWAPGSWGGHAVPAMQYDPEGLT